MVGGSHDHDPKTEKEKEKKPARKGRGGGGGGGGGSAIAVRPATSATLCHSNALTCIFDRCIPIRVIRVAGCRPPTGATAMLVVALFAEEAVPGIPVEPAIGLTLPGHCLCLLAAKCHVPGPLCSPGQACLGCVVECLTCPTPLAL